MGEQSSGLCGWAAELASRPVVYADKSAKSFGERLGEVMRAGAERHQVQVFRRSFNELVFPLPDCVIVTVIRHLKFTLSRTRVRRFTSGEPSGCRHWLSYALKAGRMVPADA